MRFLFLGAIAMQLASAPPSPHFVKIQDLDVWVCETFHIQDHYSRVLLVGDTAAATQTVMIGVMNLKSPHFSAQ